MNHIAELFPKSQSFESRYASPTHAVQAQNEEPSVSFSIVEPFIQMEKQIVPEYIPDEFTEKSELASAIACIRRELDVIEGILEKKQIFHKPTLLSSLDPLCVRVLEGVFNGEKMITGDGQEFAVPPNYASKSKLVDGDTLKLLVAADGRLVYKQIHPTARTRKTGVLQFNSISRSWQCDCGERAYNILMASVTFHRGQAGDRVHIFVPQNGESLWAAVERIERL